MKIATWNINSVRVRLEQLKNFLIQDNIDVILLQEIKCLEEVFPKEYFEDLGYNCAIFGQKTYNGVAILSKCIIEDVVFGQDIFKNDTSARYIECFINGFKFASVYVPNGQDPKLPAYPYKISFLEILREYLKSNIINEKFIIGGDYNIARSDFDVYNPKLWKGKICCTDLERTEFQRLLDIGLLDVQRSLTNESEPIYTWWDYRHGGFEKDHGLRLDYILATSNILIKNCFTNKVMRSLERPSDHAPVVLEVY